MSRDHSLAVSIAPPPTLEVEYYSSIARNILVTNESTSRILIEEISLRFDSDTELRSVEVRKECGSELEPGGVHDERIDIVPTPLFKPATNPFDVMVRFRTIATGVGVSQLEIFPSSSFVIVREPTAHVGRVFISLKQPQDLHLGRKLARASRHAGFDTFLKAENEVLGEDIWSASIEPALQASDAVIVLWTRNTDWSADGVEREIRLCRDLGKREILLLAAEASLPELYRATTIEYTSFDDLNPDKAFADAADGLRRRLIAETHRRIASGMMQKLLV